MEYKLSGFYMLYLSNNNHFVVHMVNYNNVRQALCYLTVVHPYDQNALRINCCSRR